MNKVERLFCIEPPESNPEPGLTIVARKLSPAIVVCARTTIGNCTSSYTPDFTNITAGAVADGVPIFATAYLIVLNAVSIAVPKPLASVPHVET